MIVMKMKNRGSIMKGIILGALLVMALFASGCSQSVSDINDVDIIETKDTSVSEPSATVSDQAIEDAAAELGVVTEEADLVEFGELI